MLEPQPLAPESRLAVTADVDKTGEKGAGGEGGGERGLTLVL